jgi:hypothetical protein
MANYHGTSHKNFICSLRPVCETLFYFLLLAYKTGVYAFTQRSVANGAKEKLPRESTPGWREAHEHACQALTLAMDAATKASARDHAADEITEKALESGEPTAKVCVSMFSSHIPELIISFSVLSECSLAAVPASYRRDINLMHFWDEESVRFS